MESTQMSAAEIALYDRQIRLWGVQAQETLRKSSILLITLKGLGSEIAKNLVLAGVGSLTLMDNELLAEEDLGTQLFTTSEDVGKRRAEAALAAVRTLNPRVVVEVETDSVLSGDTAHFARYNMIIATDLSISAFHLFNAAARLSQRSFYATGTHGLYGFVFADLLEHTYIVTRDKSNIATKIGPETPTRCVLSTTDKHTDAGKPQEIVSKRETYQPFILANTSPLPSAYRSSPRRLRSVTPLLPCMRALWEFSKDTGFARLPSSSSENDIKTFTALATQTSRDLQLPPELLKAEFLRSFMQNIGAELSPTCAFIGGMVAQDAVNVLTGKEQPVQNMMFFDGDLGGAPIYAFTPLVPAL